MHTYFAYLFAHDEFPAKRSCCCSDIIFFDEKKKHKNKRLWVREWISKREQEGVHAKLLQEISTQDIASYENFIRMSQSDFEYLLERITPKIKKQDTHLRNAISPSERLTLTLRFLATGKWYLFIK